MVYMPFIEVEVWDEFNTELIAILPRRWDPLLSDPLGTAGSGKVSVPFDDPVLQRHPTLLDFRNWVKFWLGDGTGSGRYFGAFQIKEKETDFIDQGEWGAMAVTVSGPTPLGLLQHFIVKHENQPPAPDASNTRAYAWTARIGPWYDETDWDDTIVSEGKWNTHITDARSGTTDKPDYQPPNWPDPDSEWIRIPGFAWQAYRTKITVPDEEDGGALVEFCLSADEIAALFIDGDRVIMRNETETGYESFTAFKMWLPAGKTQLGVLMRSKGTPGGDGIDAFLFTCYTILHKEPNQILRRSRPEHWVGHGGLPIPGWRQADVLISGMTEAQDRGNRSANLLEVDFTHDLASNQGTGEDRDWTKEVSIFAKIGESVYDVVQKLEEIKDFDVWVDSNADPAQFKLRAALQRGNDRSDNVALEPGRNLLGWKVVETDTIVNDAIVQYEGGWTSYQASDSITEHGSREAGISLGAVADDSTAEVIAGAHVERRKHARKRAGRSDIIQRDEDTDPSLTVTGSPGNTPGIDIGTGSIIKAPAGTGVHARQRLVNTTVAETTTGEVTFAVELGEVS